MLSTETGFNDFQTFQSNLNTAIGGVGDGENAGTGLLGALGSAYTTYQTNLDTTMQNAGTTMETFGETVDTVVNGENGILTQTAALQSDIESKAGLMVEDINSVTAAVTAFELEYQTKTQAIINQNEALKTSFDNVLASWAQYNEQDTNGDGEPDDNGGGDDGNGGDTGGGDDNNQGSGGQFKKGTKFKVSSKAKIYDYAGDSSGEGQYFRSDPKYKVLSTETKNGKKWLKARWYKLSSGTTGWFKASDATAYDTGGYTGDWGTSDGKMAMLHQKEIVLNASDTENFLSAIELVREIANKIDLNAASAMAGRAMQSSQISDHSQSLEQYVEITASFPNATNHSEIEEAFKNLVNMASQHANTKRK